MHSNWVCLGSSWIDGFEVFGEFIETVDKVSLAWSRCYVEIDYTFHVLVSKALICGDCSRWRRGWGRWSIYDGIRSIGGVECHCLGPDNGNVGSSCTKRASDRFSISDTVVCSFNNTANTEYFGISRGQDVKEGKTYYLRMLVAHKQI